jgi:hypothetical protein
MRLRKVESKSDSKVELGGHTWTRVGTVDGKDLYLCDDIVKTMHFNKDENNNWKDSDIRKWLNGPFYNSLSKADKDKIVRNADGDNLFCLSTEEAKSIPKSILSLNRFWYWWLRSPGSNSDGAAYVGPDGSVFYNGNYVSDVSLGVRPAFLMSSLDTKKLKEIKDAYITYKSLCNDYIDNGGDENDIEDIVLSVNKVL